MTSQISQETLLRTADEELAFDSDTLVEDDIGVALQGLDVELDYSDDGGEAAKYEDDDKESTSSDGAVEDSRK